MLRRASLTLEPGEVVALLGGNGAGKTTLLRIAATLLRPLRGRGAVFGHDLVGEASRIRELVGLLGHTPALYEDLTAEENLRFALRMRGRVADGEQLARLLVEVGLEGKGDRPVRGFSSGMRRRLALARVLIEPPRLLLLDEPYASLDRDGMLRVNRLIRATAASGGAVLLATHELEPARPVLSRSLLLQAGQVRELSGDEVARHSRGDEETEVRRRAGAQG